MTYSLQFEKRALKEWRKLAPPIRDQFKTKLQERLINPHVPAAKLRGSKDRYKIKLRASGYRMVYQVEDNTITLLVIAIGKREGNEVYLTADTRSGD
ncbi:MAG: type II toxin-antitoxin system RelE family toxin [Aeromonas sp.]